MKSASAEGRASLLARIPVVGRIETRFQRCLHDDLNLGAMPQASDETALLALNAKLKPRAVVGAE